MDKQRLCLQESLKMTENALIEANLRMSSKFTEDCDKKEAA
jgi:hypothetical protein